MILLVGGSTGSLRRMMAEGHGDVLGRLLTPRNGNAVKGFIEGGSPWACDNSAYSDFDADKFRRMVGRVEDRPRLLWVAVPDVVGDARATLDMWHLWEPELRGRVPLAFVLQDGQESLELPPADAYFVGGTTKWKLSQCAESLCREAKRRSSWLHMGRVNSLRRLRVALAFGCDSVDGTGASRWGDIELPKLIRWLKQAKSEVWLW